MKSEIIMAYRYNDNNDLEIHTHLETALEEIVMLSATLSLMNT